MTAHFKTVLIGVLVAAGVGAWWTGSHFSRAFDVASKAPTESSEVAVAVTAAQPELSGQRSPSSQPAAPRLAENINDRVCEAALKWQDSVDRQAFLDKAVQGVPRELYGMIIDKLNSAAPGSVQAEFSRAILLRWAFEEPANLAAWALNNPDQARRRDALALSAQRWAQTNPAQLMHWSAGLSAEDREWVLVRSGDFLQRTDPELFAVWRQAIQPGRERDQLELAITHEAAQSDSENVVAAMAEYQGSEFEDWRRLAVAR
jgi:hypothetical protein